MKKMEEKINSYEVLLSERDTQIACLEEKVKRAKDAEKEANKLRQVLNTVQSVQMKKMEEKINSYEVLLSERDTKIV